MSIMQTSWSDLIVGYIILGSTVVGIPALFFIITFLPGLMRTTGEQIGRKEQSQHHFAPDSTPALSEVAAPGQRR